MTTLEILSKLVAMPTVTGQLEENNKALDFIGHFLSSRGMRVVRTQHDGFGALVATIRPTKHPRIMFTAHVDVMPAPKHMFALRQEGDRLYGRGTLDMKVAIAAYLAFVDRIQHKLNDYDFGIMITSDEENRHLGVLNLLKDGFIPQAAVLLDGGLDWQIEHSAKGAWAPLITFSGKTAHGSRPWLGDSASLKVAHFINELEHAFDEPNASTNTLNVSAIEVGKIGHALNQIPDAARLTLDIRTTSDAEYQRLRKLVLRLCKKYGAVCQDLVIVPVLEHDPTDPYIVAFAASVEKITGIKQLGFTSIGVSEASYYDEYGVPSVVMYPRGAGHHGDDEWVSRQAAGQLTDVIADFARKMAATSQAKSASEPATSGV